MATVLDTPRLVSGGTGSSPTVEDMLGKYTEALNAHGPDASETQKVLGQYRDNEEFVKLAKVALFVWKRLNKS